MYLYLKGVWNPLSGFSLKLKWMIFLNCLYVTAVFHVAAVLVMGETSMTVICWKVFIIRQKHV